MCGFHCAYCDVRTEYLHEKLINFSLQMVLDTLGTETVVLQINQYRLRPCSYNNDNFFYQFCFYILCKCIPVVWVGTIRDSRKCTFCGSQYVRYVCSFHLRITRIKEGDILAIVFSSILKMGSECFSETAIVTCQKTFHT